MYYRISSKHIWTWLNCPIHTNYFCDIFINFLKHQNYGGMDFPWRDRNLLVFIKMSSFVFWWWTKVLWVWMTWGWVKLMAKNLYWQTKACRFAWGDTWTFIIVPLVALGWLSLWSCFGLICCITWHPSGLYMWPWFIKASTLTAWGSVWPYHSTALCPD